jgi:uncharacterized protein
MMHERIRGNTMTSRGKDGVDRRAFLKGGAAMAAGLGLQALLARHAEGAPTRVAFSPDYGALGPVNDQNTGLPLLHLPAGFRYRSFGWTGDALADGTDTPGSHDGMAVVRTIGHLGILVRNHEESGPSSSFADPGITYDPVAPGGTTNLLVDLKTGRLLRSWSSLGGTVRNCAGGPTPWGSWLSCEETVEDSANGYSKTHGWVYDVPSLGDTDATPLKGMGRMNHEAVAVDPRSGIIYETEDKTPCGFYRYIDENILDRRGNRPLSQLAAGLWDRSPFHGHSTFKLAGAGILQMLKVKNAPNQNLGGTFAPGTTFEVEWVTIDDPEKAHHTGTDGLGVFRQGDAKGGAAFRRLEGCWYYHRKIYLTSTNGGAASQGQVWVYDPVAETIELLFESPSSAVLNNPDNIAVSPRGGIVLCEDGNVSPQRLRGLTTDGLIFEFARNNVILPAPINAIPAGSYIGSEWAGATFSPDGKWLFVNIQTPGVTFAITGPWHHGGL